MVPKIHIMQLTSLRGGHVCKCMRNALHVIEMLEHGDAQNQVNRGDLPLPGHFAYVTVKQSDIFRARLYFIGIDEKILCIFRQQSKVALPVEQYKVVTKYNM